jgi:hypothetical protein
MRRSLQALAATVLLAVGAFTLACPAVGAQAPTTTIPADRDPGTDSIIPLPNSGREPVNEGDPGSASQYVVLGVTVVGMAAIVLLVRRESRRKRDQRTPMPDRETAASS